MKDNADLFLPAATDAIGVEVIGSWPEFEVLREPWQALERRDPQGSVFLSWHWLAEAFRTHPGRWRVILAYRGGRLLGALPLKSRVHWSSTKSVFETEYEAGGRLIWSEYTGILCDPDWENAAIARIAQRAQSLPWARLSLRYLAPRARGETFLRAFPDDRFSADWRGYRINGGETDNLLCPQVPLPHSHAAYLNGLSSKNTRQKIRRFTRRHLDSGELRISEADTARGMQRDLDNLLQFWVANWSGQKGRARAERAAGNYREVLGVARRLGLLFLPVMWRGDRPLGGLAHIVDPWLGRVHFIVAGRDSTAAEPYIGLLLHSESIRWAIEKGYDLYDFGHGNEPYKYSFGATDREVGYLSLRRRSADSATPRFDPLCTAQALRRTRAMIEDGQTERAAAACAQLAALFEGGG